MQGNIETFSDLFKEIALGGILVGVDFTAVRGTKGK